MSYVLPTTILVWVTINSDLLPYHTVCQFMALRYQSSIKVVPSTKPTAVIYQCRLSIWLWRHSFTYVSLIKLAIPYHVLNSSCGMILTQLWLSPTWDEQETLVICCPLAYSMMQLLWTSYRYILTNIHTCIHGYSEFATCFSRTWGSLRLTPNYAEDPDKPQGFYRYFSWADI